MVQVEHDGAIAYLLGADTVVEQAFAHLAVFTSILHALVEAAHGEDVTAPAAGVHAVPGGASGCDMVHQDRKPSSLYELGTFEAAPQSLCQQPAKTESPSAPDIVLGQGFADGHGQLEIASGEDVTLLGIVFMGSNEVGPRHAVLVGEDEIVGSGSAECLIENDGLAEALVFVPHMLDGQYFLHALDEVSSFLAGAVVGNDDLVGLPLLEQIAPERLFQPARVVVCGDDDAYRHGDLKLADKFVVVAAYGVEVEVVPGEVF